MNELPGYDAWKLSTPLYLEPRPSLACSDCGHDYDFHDNGGLCEECECETWTEPFDDGPPDRYDERRERRLDD